MDGEFSRLLGWIGTQGLRALIGLLLVTLPIAAVALVARMHRLPRLSAYWRIPSVTLPATLAGFLLGWCTLHADPLSPSFRVADVFALGGSWDIPWIWFLRYRADPGLYGYEWLVSTVRIPDADPLLAFVVLIIAALLVVSIVSALVALRGIDLLVGLIGIVFLCIVSQAVTIYVTALVAYTFNTLNFWAAAVAFVILQYYRRSRGHGRH